MHRLVSNSLILMLANVINLVIAFTIVILLTRYLGVADYGKYAFAKAFTALFLYVADLGLNTLLIRDIAQNKSKAGEYLSNVITLKMLISLVVLGLVYVIINGMGYPPSTTVVVYLATGIIILMSFSNVFRSVFMAFEKMSYEGFFMILSETSLLIGLLLCIVLKVRLLGIMTTFFTAWLFLITILIYVVRRRFVRFRFAVDVDLCVRLFKGALPFAILGTLITIGTNIDSVMLSKIAGDSAVGLYNAASKLVAPLGFFSEGIAVTIFPFISDKWNADREEAVFVYRKCFKLVSLFGVPTAILVAILANHIIGLFYGAQYSASASILRVVIWVAPFTYVSTLTGRVLSAINRQTILVYITITYITANVCLNIILIPLFGGVGAATALVITGGLNYLVQQYYINKFFDNKFELWEYVKLIVYSLPVGVAVFFLEKINWLAALGGGILLFVLVMFISKLVSKKDVEFLFEHLNFLKK